MIGVAAGRKFARLATNVAVRNPRLWRLFRPLVRRQFDALAPVWESMRLAESLASYEAALQAITEPPSRALTIATDAPPPSELMLPARHLETPSIALNALTAVLIIRGSLTPIRRS